VLSAVAGRSAGGARPGFLELGATLLAAVLVAHATPVPRARRRRRAAVACVAVVGAALSADVLLHVWVPADPWVAGLAPWGAGTGLAGSGAAGWAWTVAALAWTRGTWLARRPPSAAVAGTSLVVGALAFLAVFAGQASSRGGAFRTATASAGWLLFVWFFAGFAAVAWAYEQGLERTTVQRRAHAPEASWVVVLAVPLGIVAVLALVVAFAAGGAGPPVGRGLTDAADGVVLALYWLFEKDPRTWWLRLFHGLASLRVGTARAAHAHAGRAARDGGSWIVVALGAMLDALLVAVVVYGLVRVARWLMRRLRRGEERRPTAAPEERESIFSWSHLLGQLRQGLLLALRRLRAQMSRRAASSSTAVVAAPGPRVPADPVRAAYVHFLRAADAARQGRAPSETPLELAARLGHGPAVPRPALFDLTSAYNATRYGGVRADDGTGARAATSADVLAAALTGPPAVGPQAPPAAGPLRPTARGSGGSSRPRGAGRRRDAR
jgi:hypothetical protein